MARDFFINGPCMVEVKGGAHCSGTIAVRSELGLTSDPIRVTPAFHHKDLKADDFPNAPPEVLWNLADARIKMTLINCERSILDTCIQEGTGGGADAALAGTLSPAGMPMGGLKPLYASGNHYIGIILSSPIIGLPYLFPSCYLAEQPFEIPLGAGASLIQLNWRAIPYVSPTIAYYNTLSLISGNIVVASGKYVISEILSSGAVLWNRKSDF